MDSSTSNAEQPVSFDFLVKVTGDKLELQYDLLQSILMPYKDNEVPVAIVTVIGQPKSRKTLLTNFIQTRIIRLAGTESQRFSSVVTPTSGFPRSLADCPSKSVRDILDGQEGILIWTKPCLIQQDDGQSLVVFILDIWSENPSPSLYTRLVDFCITSSSMVILVEDCCVSKESNGNQWDISKSCLARLEGNEFQNLHIIIHANWPAENFHTLGLEGGKLLMNASKDQFSERLRRVIDTDHILRGYFNDVSYFLAQLKSESTVQKGKRHSSDSEHIQGLLDFSWKVVGFDRSKLFPLARNKTVLSTLSVGSHFQNGIMISNSVAAVAEATDETPFQPNNIEVEMDLCENTKGSAEVPTPSQVESKKSSIDSQANFEVSETAVENQSSVIMDVSCEPSDMKVAGSFEDSTNANIQPELGKSEADRQNEGASEIPIVGAPTEAISVPHSSVLGGNVDDTREEAMDLTETPVKALEISKVSLCELQYDLQRQFGEAYRKKLRAFIDNSSQTELFFKDEDVKSLHLQLISQIREDLSSQFAISQDKEFYDTMNNECDKLFTDFKQENSESRRLYNLHFQEGEKNSKLKFDQIIAKLRVQVLQNPLEIVDDLRNDDLESYYEGFTENLPEKLKSYFRLWYSCKSDDFKTDFDFMKAMMKCYEEKMHMILISSTCKKVTKKEFEEAHVLHSKNAEERASNHKWSHQTLNDLAKEAIVLMRKTFFVCFGLTYRTLEAHRNGLKTFVDNHSNCDSLYFEDNQLNSEHSKLKAKIEQYDVKSQIPPSLVDVLLAKMKTGCDEVFLDFVTKYSEERASFYNLLQQVKSKTKLKFDEEVQKLELLIREDPSNLSYDLRKANLSNYVKALTKNMTNSKWRNYFISWYSHELDDFTKDIYVMISAIQLYRNELKTFCSENVCVKENEFHNISTNLAAAHNNHTWKNNSLKVLSGIGIELTRQSFNQLNLGIINKEEEMANQASIFAEEHYNHLMKSQILERTFTDSEVKNIHETYVKAVVDSFLRVHQFKYTYMWQRHLNELGNRLDIYLFSYLKENQQNVDRLERTKKNLMNDCTKLYNDNMNKLVADRVLPDETLRSYHSRSANEASQILNERMNSSTEKFNKNSWVNELEEKLRVYFNAFEVENNRLLNEARNHQPAAAAAADYGNATSTQSCGVGIYFGPDIVRLGIYVNPQTIPKYLEFSPFVTFERNEIVFFNRHSSHHDHFDVYKTLVEEKNFPRTVFVSGKSYQLWTEEIVAVFLNKIKSKAETKFRVVLTSCAVAVSAFMNTSSKQMLKTALTLAGFERSTIIQSTTAVGLSYVVTNKVYGNVPVAFIHQAGSVFDVAIALINQTSICIRRISGLPYLEKSSNWNLSKFLGTTDIQDVLSKKVKKLVTSTLASSDFSAWQLEAVVMVQGETNFINDRSAITDPLLCRSLNTLHEAQGIVLGAAAFNAFQNKIPGASNLEYNEVFPYTVIADITGEQIIKIVKHNDTMAVSTKNRRTHLPFADVWSSRKVRINEFAVEKENIVVGVYSVNAVHSSRNFFVIVDFNYEGLIEVEAKTSVNSSSIPVQSKTRGLGMAQQCSAVENLRQILIPTVAPCLPSVPVKSVEVKTNAAAVENEMTSPVVVEPVAQDAKTKLVDLIKDVRDRLATSTATNPMILARINDRIIECEGLLEKDGVKEKQIEMQIKLLDLAAAKIK